MKRYLISTSMSRGETLGSYPQLYSVVKDCGDDIWHEYVLESESIDNALEVLKAKTGQEQFVVDFDCEKYDAEIEIYDTWRE